MGPDPDERRLFVGLGLSGRVAARLATCVGPILHGAEGLRRPATEDLHVTLAFLGPFPEARRPALERALQEELRGLAAPELVVTGTGAFPDRRRPRVLWAGVEEEGSVGRLPALHNRVVQAGLSQGWRPRPRERDRPFRAHVTVARAPGTGGAAVPAEFFDLRFALPWLPVEVTLYEARRGPGARYHGLQRVPLVVLAG